MVSIGLRRIFFITAASLALIAGAAAEVVYNRGNNADPETLDPHKTSTVQEAHILWDLTEGLVAYNTKAEVIPGVAEKWEVSENGKTYTFALRKDAKWSNGDPVTAEDFVYSYRRMLNPETGAKYANILFPILNAEEIVNGKKKPEELGVAAPDDYTVVITLKEPTPYFIQLLTHQTSAPVHRKSIEKFGTDFVKPGNFVTNGAFMLAENVPNSRVKLVKNPHFHDAKNVQIDVVNVIPTPDFSAALRRYQAGEIDTMDELPADQIKAIKKNFGSQIVLGPYLGVTSMVVNTSKAPFSDVRIRQALSLVIDREFITENIWNETMVPAYSFVPPGIPGYTPAEASFKDDLPLDREEEAKKLLKEAGYGPGLKPLKIEIRYNTTDNNRNTVVAIGDMWKKIGAEVTFLNSDTKTHFAHLRDGGDFDVARYGWIADYPDPQNFLFLVEANNIGFNYGKYNNPEYDKLMAESAQEIDLQKRAKILHKAEEVFMRDLPWIPFMYYGNMKLISPKIKGYHDNPRGVYPSRFLTKE